MKSISNILCAALLLLGTACSKTQEGSIYTPNRDDARQIHFIQSSIEKEFAQHSETGRIDVEIARTGNRGAYRIGLMQKGTDERLFTVPEEVVIPDGAYSVVVPVEVDLTGGSAGSNFKTTLYISDREAAPGDGGAQISQYADKMTLTASFELEWETLYRTDAEGERIPQLATYHYNLYYTGRDSGLEMEKAVGADIFRVKDWASGVTFRFIRHADNTCTVPAQSIGFFNTNYNEYVYVADMAVYTGNEDAYASYPCTYDEQTKTYTFYLIYYVSGGYFSQGTERLVLDSDPDTTPVVEIAFEGLESTPTGFLAPKLVFTPNEYARSYQAAVVAGDITADKSARERVRQQIIDGTFAGVTPVRTLSEADESVWNVPKGNYTAVALAYDSLSAPCDLYAERFTCDPQNEYAVQVHEFEFYAPENNSNYSPYNTLVWEMRTSNVKTMKYLCVNALFVDYLCEALDMTPEELTAANGRDVDEETIADLNSEEGRGTVFQNLDEGTSYTLLLLMQNEFGDSMLVRKTATTAGYFARDFDRTKTLADFTGAFSVSAIVNNGSGDAESTFRMDISRIGGNRVTIEGMTDMRDFAPSIGAYYDEELHMIIVEPQYAGPYGGAHATLGFSDGMSIYWGNESMAIGYIGERLYWAASPYAGHAVNSYMFLLFSSPQATGSNYLREYAGSKQYSAVKMTPLKLEPSAASAAPASEPIPTRGTIRTADRTVTTFLAGGAVARTAKRIPAAAQPAAAAAQSGGKTLRTDLRLRTR